MLFEKNKVYVLLLACNSWIEIALAVDVINSITRENKIISFSY